MKALWQAADGVRGAQGALCPRVLIALLWLVAACATADDRLERSRAIAADFQGNLGKELRAALDEGGLVNAIAVCAEAAPAMATAASEAAGAEVGRTALRVRNFDNAPDAAARAALHAMEQRLASGEAMPIESFESRADGGFRYMRAITLQPLCANCHGESLAPEVAEALEARYPEDQATGFRVGDLRGAFLIDWPASSR